MTAESLKNNSLLYSGSRVAGDVGQHVAFGQDAGLLVEHDVEQGVGVDKALHEDVHLASLGHGDGLLRGFEAVGGLHEMDVVGVGAQLVVFLHLGAATHEHSLDETNLQGAHNALLRVAIFGPNHSHTLTIAALRQVHHHIFKTLDCFHSLCRFLVKQYCTNIQFSRDNFVKINEKSVYDAKTSALCSK